jgi:hypothetical protein
MKRVVTAADDVRWADSWGETVLPVVQHLLKDQ